MAVLMSHDRIRWFCLTIMLYLLLGGSLTVAHLPSSIEEEGPPRDNPSTDESLSSSTDRVGRPRAAPLKGATETVDCGENTLTERQHSIGNKEEERDNSQQTRSGNDLDTVSPERSSESSVPLQMTEVTDGDEDGENSKESSTMEIPIGPVNGMAGMAQTTTDTVESSMGNDNALPDLESVVEHAANYADVLGRTDSQGDGMEETMAIEEEQFSSDESTVAETTEPYGTEPDVSYIDLDIIENIESNNHDHGMSMPLKVDELNYSTQEQKDASLTQTKMLMHCNNTTLSPTDAESSSCEDRLDGDQQNRTSAMTNSEEPGTVLVEERTSSKERTSQNDEIGDHGTATAAVYSTVEPGVSKLTTETDDSSQHTHGERDPLNAVTVDDSSSVQNIVLDITEPSENDIPPTVSNERKDAESLAILSRNYHDTYDDGDSCYIYISCTELFSEFDLTAPTNKDGHPVIGQADAFSGVRNATTGEQHREEILNSQCVTCFGPWGHYTVGRRRPADLSVLYELFRDVETSEQNPYQKYNNTAARHDFSGEQSDFGNVTLEEEVEDIQTDEEIVHESIEVLVPDDPLRESASLSSSNEFVDGLDDLDKLFEGIDPPDELDVGVDGTSIQEVLMGSATRVLFKRISVGAKLVKQKTIVVKNKVMVRLHNSEVLTRPLKQFRQADGTFSPFRALRTEEGEFAPFQRLRNRDGEDPSLSFLRNSNGDLRLPSKEQVMAALRWIYTQCKTFYFKIDRTLDNLFEGGSRNAELEDLNFKFDAHKSRQI